MRYNVFRRDEAERNVRIRVASHGLWGRVKNRNQIKTRIL